MPTYSNLKNPLSRRIQNLSRGSSNYNDVSSRATSRYTIDKLFLVPTKYRVGFVEGYHAAKLLRLQAEFKTLAIFKEDITIWKKVIANKSISFSENMLLFAASYIADNQEQTVKVQNFANEVNRLLFEGQADELQAFLGEIHGSVAQSICFFRTYMAAWQKNPKEILERLESRENSFFISKIISKILVTANTYTGSDQSIDDVLTMFNADFGKDDIKTYAVNFILGKTEGDIDDIAMQLFLVMRCHPYDVREVILTYLETKISKEHTVTELENECLQLIHNAHACCRSRNLNSILTGVSTEYVKNASELPLLVDIGVSAESHALWVRVFSDNEFLPSGPTGKNFLDALSRMRRMRFPSEIHYRIVLTSVFRYKHLCFGRLLKGFFSGLYLVKRAQRSIEIRDSLRIIAYSGKLTNFVLTSPKGITAARIVGHSAKSHLENLELIEYGSESNDRYLIKNDMWKLKSPEYNKDYTEWFKKIRELVVYKRQYYTGVTWDFLDVIEDEHRIDAFKGNPEAYYALLIWFAETETRFSTRLRLAIKYSEMEYESFFDLLDDFTESFGQSIHLFLLEFCTPQTLLKMKFADTYVEALTMRFHGLYHATRKVGYSDYLNEGQLRNEESAFVANALLSSIGKNRFSVGWKMFKSDYLRRKEAAFTNILYFINNTSNIIPDQHEKTDHVVIEFDNSFVQKIVHNSHKEFLCDKILIDLFNSFISHPSQGIEAILSIRIRHIHFRKEFADVISDLKAPHRSELTMHEKRVISTQYEEKILSLVVEWSQARMVTAKSNKPEAIFNIFANDEEWAALRSGINFESIESILDGFIEWMSAKLEGVLLSAREAIMTDLLVQIEGIIDHTAQPTSSKKITSTDRKVSALLSSAIRQKSMALQSWFTVPEGDILEGLTTLDIRELAYKNYFRETKQGKLKIQVSNHPIDELAWGDSKIRLAYYLLLELVENAIKYGCKVKTSIVIVPYLDSDYIGILVSNRCDASQTMRPQTIKGHPNVATLDVFEEGDTGLKKIAALSASLLGEKTDITAYGYRNNFRLKIPLARNPND